MKIELFRDVYYSCVEHEQATQAELNKTIQRSNSAFTVQRPIEVVQAVWSTRPGLVLHMAAAIGGRNHRQCLRMDDRSYFEWGNRTSGSIRGRLGKMWVAPE